MARPRKDYTGVKFGKKTLIKFLPEKSHNTYLSQCECGHIGTSQLASLKRGESLSCTSCAAKKRYEHIESIVGKKINDWLVLSELIEKTKRNNKFYTAQCKCGTITKKTKRQIQNAKFCLKCSQKNVGINKEIKYTEKYLGTTIGKWKIIDRIHENKLYKFVGICPCGSIKKSDSIAVFKKSTGCIKCCPKNNSAGLKSFFMNSAKKLEGTSNLYFKIIKVTESKDGHIRFQCKCISCGKKLILKNVQINTNLSCGCARQRMLPRGSNHHKSIINEIEASSIKELFKSGYYTKDDLAKQFNMSKTQIYYIISGRSWKHI